jgi:hypothetical protein
MTVRQLLSQIDSAELTEWMAYSTLEPFGESVADYRHGIAVAALANVNRDHKRRREPFVPEDFIPWHESHRSAKEHDGVLVDDPELQANLIRRLLSAQQDGGAKRI